MTARTMTLNCVQETTASAEAVPLPDDRGGGATLADEEEDTGGGVGVRGSTGVLADAGRILAPDDGTQTCHFYHFDIIGK